MNYNPFSLEGRNILITGASSGIGRSCAIECAKSGANLLLLGRDLTRLDEVLTDIQKDTINYKGAVSVHSTDLSNGVDALNPVVDEFVSKYGKLDGLIHSAGIEKTMPLSGMKDSDYSSIFNINVIAGFQIARIISKRKNSNDNSSFVFISSITALVGRKGIIGYSASKGALNSGIKSMALELADRGIRANCISPGTILTPLLVKYLESLTPEEKAKRLDGYPLGIGTPEDIAYAAIYLLSGASRWITGQSLIIDGGYTSR